VRFALPDVFTFLVFVGTAVLLFRRRDPGWRRVRIPTQVLAGLALFFLAAVTSFIATEDPIRSVTELIAYGVNLVLFSLVVYHVRTRERLFTCLRAWEVGVAFAVAGTVVGVVLLFTGNDSTFFTEGPKVASLFKKSGQLSAYLLPSIPLIWFNLRELSTTRRARILRGALLVGTVLSVVASGSRGGLVIAGFLVLVLFGWSWLRGLRGWRAAFTGAVIGLGLLVLVPRVSGWIESLPWTFQRAFSILNGVSSLEELSESRYHQFLGWKVAAAEYPWTGVGTGDFRTRATAFVPQSWTPHEIHNTYLGVWAETGLFGVFALALLCLGILRAAWHVVTRGDPKMVVLGVALVLAIVTLFVYGTMNFGLRMRHLWSIFGLALAAWGIVRARDGDRTALARQSA
jgi:hypothetical protein